jgi:hypothetical protein
MKSLRVYGDSFAALELGSWTKMLADLLKIPIDNKAISGSSTEYSIYTFINDVKEDEIGDKDIIVFVTSNTGRLYFTQQLEYRPETASNYTRKLKVFDKSDEWYWKNKDHIEWWMVNNSTKMQSITFESYVQLLKNFALSKPSCVMVVLQAFNNGYSGDIFNNVPPHNFLRPAIFLRNISHRETDQPYASHLNYVDWTEFTKIDPRPNHLTIPNLTILANLLVESIQNLTIDNITYDKFKTNIIDKIISKEQYLKYVADGLLPHRYDILNNLK